MNGLSSVHALDPMPIGTPQPFRTTARGRRLTKTFPRPSNRMEGWERS